MENQVAIVPTIATERRIRARRWAKPYSRRSGSLAFKARLPYMLRQRLRDKRRHLVAYARMHLQIGLSSARRSRRLWR